MHARRAAATVARYREGVPADCPLTFAELEALTLLAEGKTRKQTAIQLGKTISAVWHLVSRASDRLGTRSTAEAILVCHEERWLDIKVGRSHVDAPLTEVQRNYVRAFTALIKASPTAQDRLIDAIGQGHEQKMKEAG